MPKKQNVSSEEKARLLLDAVEDRKAVDPVVLDLRDKSVMLADFFLICTGTSSTHIRAIAERVQERVDELNWPRPRIEGEAVAEWILLDFGDVVLHIMAEETRRRYRLEEFWTTPQPRGALPPTPAALAAAAQDEEEREMAAFDLDEDEETIDDFDFDEDELDDAAFFEKADEEVEPVDEEE